MFGARFPAVMPAGILVGEYAIMSNNNQMKNLAFSMMAYTSASIFGPLIIFGGIGYWVSTYRGGKGFLFVGVGIAFMVTMVLQFFKIRKLLQKMEEESGNGVKVQPKEDSSQ